MKGIAIKYTEEMEYFLKENVKGVYYKDLAEMFNKKFGTNLTADNVSVKCLRMGVRNGIDGCFKKGQIPFNKGKKMSADMYKRCAGTMFKKGQMPHNHRPMGSERIQADGYIYVKIGEPKKWKQKHHIIWEQYNPPIDKKKDVLIFLDGDRTNCDISNLKCISRSYDAGMSFLGLWSKNAELNKTALNVVKLFKETKRKRDETDRKATR